MINHHRNQRVRKPKGWCWSETSGFTVLEVIVAISILAVIMVPLTTVLMQSLRQSGEVSDRLQRSNDSQRIGAAWVRDVQSLDRVGTDASGTCAGTTSGGTDLVTFYWDQTPFDAATGQMATVPHSATWAVTGTGAGMNLVRRTCQAGVIDEEEILASHIGEVGQSPLQVMHGPGGPGNRNFCTATTCTLVITGSFSYEISANRRVPGDVASDQAPPPPTITGVAEQNTYLSVAWIPPSLPTGVSAVTGYRVEAWRTPTGGLVSATEITASSNSADVKNLVNGTSYWLVVYAKNASGFGEPSDVWGPAVPQDTPPEMPLNLTLAAGPVNVPGTLDAAWNVPANDGGPDIDKYRLTVTPTSGGGSPLTFELGNVLAYQIPGLDPGRQYSVTVAAHNSLGWGPESDPALGVTRPPKPTLDSVGSGPQRALVSFTVAGNGGSSGSGMALTSTDAIRVTATCVVPSGSCTDRTFAFNHPSPGSPNSAVGPLDTTLGTPSASLVNGQAYNVVVEVQNESGWGPASDPMTVTPLASPAAPAAVVSIQPTGVSQQLTFTIAPGTDSGGTAITSYKVAYQGSGGEIIRDIPAAVSGNTTFTWVPGDTSPATPLTNFGVAGFKVQACNSVGCSAQTIAYTAQPGPVPVAATPSVVRGSAAGSIVVTSDTTPGTGNSATQWSVVCVNGAVSRSGSITGTNPLTLTNMPAGISTCTSTPTNVLQRTVAGVSGTVGIAGTPSSANVEVYVAPAKPLTPTVAVGPTGVVNQVNVTPGANQASGGSNTALTYIATCAGQSSTQGTGTRTVAGLTPNDTVSCRIVAVNIAGYQSAPSDAVSIKLRRFAPTVESFEGTKTIVVQNGGQNANTNRFRGMAVVKHDPGLTVTSFAYDLQGSSGTVTSPTIWKQDTSNSAFTTTYVWVNVKPGDGNWAGIPGSGIGANGKYASLTFSVTGGDTAAKGHDYFAAAEWDVGGREDLPLVYSTSDGGNVTPDYGSGAPSIGGSSSINLNYACDDNDGGDPDYCDSMKIRVRRIDVPSGQTVMLDCGSSNRTYPSGFPCETRDGTGSYVYGNFNADDGVRRDYDYTLPGLGSGFWVIEGAPCNETSGKSGKWCPNPWTSTPPTAGSLGSLQEANFYQILGSFWVP